LKLRDRNYFYVVEKLSHCPELFRSFQPFLVSTETS
jgi:hypothetical protein